MRAVIQRVKQARVRVEERTLGEIKEGLLCFLGVGKNDQETDADYLAVKIPQLRIFADNDGKFNRSLLDIGGSILVVSQFTLFADCRKGRRPSFSEAAEPEQAKALYHRFITKLQEQGITVAQGEFQASMEVELVNDGPVTLLLDTKS